MAQYDLLLTQNVAPTGVEFTERYILLGKGGLLSQNSSGVPVVLPVGTDGYQIVADSTQESGLKWQVISAGHAQNTDTGTTSTTFAIDSDGHNLPITAESASKLGFKVAGGATYADIQAKDATFNKVTVSANPVATTDLANKGYVDTLLSTLNGALVFKGNIKTTGGDITPTLFNALSTYNVGWQYRVAEVGTYKGVVCEIGDTLIAIVARLGTGELDSDWTVSQANIDGAVVGPVSSSDNYIALFNGATGKLLKQSASAIGTMAYETATNYVPKTTYTANSILYATTSGTPVALTVAPSTFVARDSSGDIAALTTTQARALLNVADGATNYVHPTTAGNLHIPSGGSSGQILQWSANGTAKWITISGDTTIVDNGTVTIANSAVSLAKMADVASGTIFYRKTASTGAPEVQTLATLKSDLGTMPVAWVTAPASMTATGADGQVAKDANFFYVCTGTNVWKRFPMATTWAN